MPRYVILRHECPPGYVRPSHWDLMLEAGGVLRTWALLGDPAGSERIAADALDDHRLDYLDYEGPVAGNRGTVARWDQGTYQVERESDEQLVVWLRGEKLQGQARLARADDAAHRWYFELPG